MAKRSEAHPSSPVSNGDTVAGKYRVERVIHDGGRCRVVEAIQLDSGSRVVLRLPGPLYSLLPDESCSRLRDAARHAALLPGDRAERPTDLDTLDTGEPFTATPLLEGIDLGTKLEQDGGLPVLDAIDVAIQVCEAMADAHAVGVLHCDLRPEKLFMSTRDGQPFVTVLMSAISVLHSSDGSSRTPLGLDHRADIYSLGITSCVLLAGKPPFWDSTHKSPSGRTTFVRGYIPLSITRPEISSPLASVIEKASSRNPDDRYQSMASFAMALGPYAPDRSRSVLRRIARRAKSTS